MSVNEPDEPDRVRRAEPAPPWRRWLPWIGGALALLILLSLFRGCGGDSGEMADTSAPAPDMMPATIAPVTLPGGGRITGEPGQLSYDLASYLASEEAQGRRFTFENLHFATGSTTLRISAEQAAARVAHILSAYPTATVRIEAFTSERGDAGADRQLSEDRAAAIARVIASSGIDPGRVSSGAMAEPPAEGPRTDLVVLTK